MPFLAQLIALGIPLTLAGICAIRKNPFGWVVFSTSFSLILIFVAFFWIEDRLDGTVGSHDICKIAKEVRKPNETVITSSFLGRAANYYLKEKPTAIFVGSPAIQEGKAKDNFRPFYPFYSYHALRQIKLETELLNFVQEKGTVLCIGEKRDFELAMVLIRKSDFAAAQKAFFDFLTRYPKSGYAPSGLFWLGNAQYQTRDYREAILNFRQMISAAPDHLRAPEALLSVANCQAELKDTRAARKTLDDLIKAYPASEAAGAAKDRLKLLK
jgi:tol-pal system protein YbgF